MVYGGKLFDQLATFIYDTVENLRQYKTFLRNLNVVEVPKYSEQVALAQLKKNAPPAVEPNEEEIHQGFYNRFVVLNSLFFCFRIN